MLNIPQLGLGTWAHYESRDKAGTSPISCFHFTLSFIPDKDAAMLESIHPGGMCRTYLVLVTIHCQLTM